MDEPKRDRFALLKLKKGWGSNEFESFCEMRWRK